MSQDDHKQTALVQWDPFPMGHGLTRILVWHLFFKRWATRGR